jgi:hypothetical protein
MGSFNKKRLINNGAPKAMVALAKKWLKEGKSFYLGPEIFWYGGRPVNYYGADDVSRNIGSWSVYSSDCPVPRFCSLKKEEIEEIAFSFAEHFPPKFESSVLMLDNCCNIKCHFCPYHGEESDFYKKNYSREITCKVGFETAKRRIDKLIDMGLETVFIGSDGEAALAADYERIMNYAAQKGLKQHITTNGTFFHEKFVRHLASFGNIKSLKFSLNAATFETWSKVTGVSIEKIYETSMQAPLLAKKMLDGTEVSVSFVKTAINEHETKEFLDYWVPQVDGVYIAHALRFDEFLDNYYDQFNEPLGICDNYMKMVYVLASGIVVPCCSAVYHYNDKNLSQLPYIDIDNASVEKIIDMMKSSFKNPHFKKICAHCVQFRRRGEEIPKVTLYGYNSLRFFETYYVSRSLSLEKERSTFRKVLSRISCAFAQKGKK